jgi:endonuclease III
MAQPSRTAQIAKIHKVLKKYYKPVNPEPSRSVIEHLLFACCLENAPYDATEEAFAALSHNFFDWNEVRVSTVRELAEEMPRLPDPTLAAQRIKRVLQSIFDATYAFDLEDLHKLNLGPATEKLGKLDGSTPFSVAYVVQAALGGHAIPVDQGVIKALEAADMITSEEIQAGQINGLERAITKPKGCEFASLLHQLGADFIANPNSPALLQILVDLNPAAAERMTRRRPKRVDDAEPQPAAKGNAAAGAECPPQAETATGEPEAKRKRAETRKKAVEKPASPGQHEPKQVEAEPHEPAEAKAAEAKHGEAKNAEAKHAEAKNAEAKHQEPKQVEAKPAETKRAVSQSAGGKPVQAKAHAPKSSKAPSGETKPAEANPPASKAPSAKVAEVKSAEQKSSAKHEPEPAEEEGKETKEEEPAESPPAKRKPTASKKETAAKKGTPAVESKEHPAGEKEKKTAATS